MKIFFNEKNDIWLEKWAWNGVSIRRVDLCHYLGLIRKKSMHFEVVCGSYDPFGEKMIVGAKWC